MFSTLSNPLGLLFVIIVLIGGQSQALNVVLTNDDGWATANIRAQFDALNSAGFNVRRSVSRVINYSLSPRSSFRLLQMTCQILDPRTLRRHR